jgi:hypothetical protein
MNAHPHTLAVREYLDNAGITPETLRYAATHESLCRSWIFDLLTGLADTMDPEGCNHPSEHVTSDGLRWPLVCDSCRGDS